MGWSSGGAAGGGGGLNIPEVVSLLASSNVVAWTDMPAALTDFLGITNTTVRHKLDLTAATQVRLVARMATAGSVNAELRMQYSTDESTWLYMDGSTGPLVNVGAAGTRAGSWVNLVAGAKADVFLRLQGINGDGVADPQFGDVTLQVK
jgi:hypothetical protein